jgi:hypothetical protein
LSGENRKEEEQAQLVEGEKIGRAKVSESLRHSTEEPRLSSPNPSTFGGST